MPRFQIHAACLNPDFDMDPIVIEARLDEGGHIDRSGLVGWYTDGEGRFPITEITEDGVIQFENESSWRTNLLRKTIAKGELFAIGDDLRGKDGEDYWVYRIDSMRAL